MKSSRFFTGTCNGKRGWNNPKAQKSAFQEKLILKKTEDYNNWK